MLFQVFRIHVILQVVQHGECERAAEREVGPVLRAKTEEIQYRK